MSSANTYDIIIVGGGLAGLSLATILAGRRYKVLVLEKDSYPRHKVCGEYISMESKPFLEGIGLPIGTMNLPCINRLQVTDTKGNEVNEQLTPGGFGISRYLLDAKLATLAQNAGATVITKSKVDDIGYDHEVFTVSAKDKMYTAKVVSGSWGKRSNMDISMKRSFTGERSKSLNNYIGIKYHINYPWPKGRIGLHNFTDGYCGISAIEDDKTCLCYLTTAANLQSCDNDIKKMESNILMKNPSLAKIFSDAKYLYESPLAISQVSFQKKEQVMNHILLAGDAAGMIAPLCGNGMSMAFRAAKMSSTLIDNFLQGKTSRNEMEMGYASEWKKIFSSRIALGRVVQSNFGKDGVTSFFLKAANYLPMLRKTLIKGVSGMPF